MVAVTPVSVLIVVLIVSVGGVVSTVAVTPDVVEVLPAVSVALAVKLWLPLGKRSRRVTPVAGVDYRRTQQGCAVIDLHRADPTGIAHRA